MERTGPMSATEGGVDRDYALERVGGDRELLAEIIALFVGDCPRLLRDIEETAADADAFHLAAHRLKGSLLQFGAFHAADLCQQLEDLGRESDLAGVPALLPALREEVDRVIESLEVLAGE